MKNFRYLIFAISTLTFVFSFTYNLASPCDSPIVGDHSGAPGETNCSGCHSAPVNPNIPELTFAFGNNEISYMPGKTYNIKVGIKRFGHDKFGFVCSSLDTLNTSKGVFLISNTATTRKYTLGGRNYISHTPCGADSANQISWTYQWTAPTTNKGAIKLYMSMLVANHDHALTGDTTYTRVLTLLPSMNTEINILRERELKIYLSQIDNSISIEGIRDEDIKQIFIYSIGGKNLIEIDNINSKIYTIKLNEYIISKGLFVIKVNTNKGSYSEKIFLN